LAPDRRRCSVGLPKSSEHHNAQQAVLGLNAESGSFDPSLFKDEYGEALLALINKKAKTEVVRTSSSEAGSANVVNLMEALKKSVGKAERRPIKAAAASKRAAVKRANPRRKAS